MKPNKETLQELYLSQRLTTRTIGAQFGVSKTQVLRWLRADEVERRCIGRGLESRGVVAPTADELHQMIHVEHLGYEGVAKRYGVDSTAVYHWLNKHGITRPTPEETRFKGKPKAVNVVKLVEMYQAGASTRQLANQFGVGPKRITSELLNAGCALRLGGFKGGIRYACNDGHQVLSVYEKRVDDWLHFHGFAHECEPRLPFNRRAKADFLVGDVYIEIWGVVGSSVYAER